jgi:hypothetical protein
MRLLSFIICLLVSLSLQAQVQERAAQKTSDILDQLTAQWKSDSLGLQGYRYDYFTRLRKSRPDSISREQVQKYLGRPNQMSKFASGKPWRDHVEYVYFILNIDPTGKPGSFTGLYLSFVFDEEKNYLEEIKEGDICP